MTETPVAVKTIRFLRRGEVVSVGNVPPSRTLLELLREDLCSTGTKEGCGEGDCGACTVVLAEPDAATDGSTLRFKAVNSCIRLAHSVDGMALWTTEDIAAADGTPHPVQQAMVQCHASQCGFCTPGFVMSLFGMYQNHVATGQVVTRELAQQALSGNLCRCTGYRPIFDAAQAMGALPAAQVDTPDLLQKLEQIRQSTPRLVGDLAYKLPETLAELLVLRAETPSAQLVAGCTDVGLWVTKQHQQFTRVLDLTRVAELRRISRTATHLKIGAAVTLADAFAALVAERPQLHTFATRFAGLPVRNSGTLGGNVANGSPIGDSMPLLIALNSTVVLASVRGERELPLAQLYTGYRQNVMAPDEVLAWITVPTANALENTQVYKISKRFDDDISAVCLAINLHLDGGHVTHASIGVGGVAATPVRAVQTEAALRGQHWTLATVQRAMAVLRAEFTPLSDMRASAAYRTAVLGNLLQRYWLESQGLQGINLQSCSFESTV
ncbi:MAG: xanthine dehydrogenase small subunit [Polaromonas sp.]